MYLWPESHKSINNSNATDTTVLMNKQCHTLPMVNYIRMVEAETEFSFTHNRLLKTSMVPAVVTDKR